MCNMGPFLILSCVLVSITEMVSCIVSSLINLYSLFYILDFWKHLLIAMLKVHQQLNSRKPSLPVSGVFILGSFSVNICEPPQLTAQPQCKRLTLFYSVYSLINSPYLLLTKQKGEKSIGKSLAIK